VTGNASTRVAGAPHGLYVLAVTARAPLNNPLVKQALALSIDRELIVKELWRGRGIVPSGPIAKGDNHFDASLPPLAYNPKEARERLKKAGYKNEEIVIETTGATPHDKPMSEAIRHVEGQLKRVGKSSRPGVAQKNRDKSFKGLWWSYPTSTLGDPDGMMWRLLAPGGPQDYWRNAKFDELGEAARFSIDEKFRAQAYKEMTKVVLEHLPWLPVIQPYEDYGLQKYVEWTPNPNQQFEIRKFNLKLARVVVAALPVPLVGGRWRDSVMRGFSPSSVTGSSAPSSRSGSSRRWSSSSCACPAIRCRCCSRRTRRAARSSGCGPSSASTGRSPCSTASFSPTSRGATSAAPSTSASPPSTWSAGTWPPRSSWD
jgi:hypothetical protein